MEKVWVAETEPVSEISSIVPIFILTFEIAETIFSLTASKADTEIVSSRTAAASIETFILSLIAAKTPPLAVSDISKLVPLSDLDTTSSETAANAALKAALASMPEPSAAEVIAISRTPTC